MPATRTVTLPTGRTVSLRDYLDGVRTAKADPGRRFTLGYGEYYTGAEVVALFVSGMQERITAEVPRWADWPHDPPGYREDRKGAAKRLLARFRRGLERACKWCGSPFTPHGVSDRFCSPDCRRCYCS